MTAVSGGKFWSGGDTGQWQGIGGKFADSGAGMIAFGTVSGGAGAALTGGNFWQGAFTGLIFSSLSHNVHKTTSKSLVDKRLRAKGYNPDGTANIHQSQLSDFAEEIFPELMDQTDSPSFLLKDAITSSDGSSNYGQTIAYRDSNGNARASHIEISRIALTSWRSLASTIGHELNHVFVFNSGAYDKWTRRYNESYAIARSEWQAQVWEQRVGGIPSMNILNDNYNIMMSIQRRAK